MKTAYITAAQLEKRGACSDQIALFREKFGERVRVTEKRCLSVATEFDWGWASRFLLSREGQDEYERVRAPALAEYERIRASAWAEYERIMASARVSAPGRASAWAEYKLITAPAFAKLYIQEAQS